MFWEYIDRYEWRQFRLGNVPPARAERTSLTRFTIGLRLVSLKIRPSLLRSFPVL